MTDLDIPYWPIENSFESEASKLDAFGHIELRHMMVDELFRVFNAPRQNVPPGWNDSPARRYVWLIAWLNDIPLPESPRDDGAPWLQLGFQTHKVEPPAAKDFIWWLNRKPST